ncbi:sirohydrochlorin chelatase [Actinomadura sp. 1N219]|uniref:sirohydrochlorin chelatase n=1 Tax=Actinomadura sp. 1N219 TaxID=3375152 RepID=UPI0037B391A7
MTVPPDTSRPDPGAGAGAGTGRTVLRVGGHECPPGALRGCRAGAEVAGPGRGLSLALAARPRAVVVPMTLGRDPALAPAAAQAIAWTARGRGRGDLLLAEPLGSVTHLVGWLRAALVRAMRGASADRAVLLVAPAGAPEDDAELFKVARLVRRHVPVRWVEVAIDGGEPDVPEGVDRCHRLGAREVVLVPASLAPPPACDAALTAGPLLGPAAVDALVRQRAAEAERRWHRDGDDGLAAGHAHHHHHAHTQSDHHHLMRPLRRAFKGAAVHGG